MRSYRQQMVILFLWVLIGFSQVALAENVRYVELDGFSQWLEGAPETTAVTEDGAVILPPDLRSLYEDAASSFNLLQTAGKSVILSKVETGEILWVEDIAEKPWKMKRLFQVETGLVTALAVQAGRFVWFATAMPTKIYFIDLKAKQPEAKLFADPNIGYIWSLLPKSAQSSSYLLASSGEPAAVWSFDERGQNQSWFQSEDMHLRHLIADTKHGLFVAGSQKGIVYHATDGKHFKALFDTGNIEITSMILQGNFLYVAAVTGFGQLLDGDAHSKSPKNSGNEVFSQVFKLAFNGSAELLAASRDEVIFSMIEAPKQAFGESIWVATGSSGKEELRGRIYQLEPQHRRVSLLYQSPSRRLTHLLATPLGIAAVAAEGGKIGVLSASYRAQGEYLSQTFDAGGVARFGMLQIFGSWKQPSQVQVQIRTGHTSKADNTWSAWSERLEAPGLKNTEAAIGRFMQFRLQLKSHDDTTPQVYRLRLAYQRQNNAPFIRQVTTLAKGQAVTSLPKDEIRSKIVQLSEKEDSSDEAKRFAPARVKQSNEAGALTVVWFAEDINGDDLRYDLWLKSMDSNHWQLLKEELSDNFYTLNSKQWADGYYQFQVRASDKLSNAPGLELEDSKKSRYILIDNTPPVWSDVSVQVKKNSAILHAKLHDDLGPIQRLLFSLDGSDSRALQPLDGIVDGPSEEILQIFSDLNPGEHQLTLWAVDDADNDAVVSSRFVVP